MAPKPLAKWIQIFGPGNRFVTEAKQQVSQDARGAAIDMPAGPSEVLVIADDNANPVFVAADLSISGRTRPGLTSGVGKPKRSFAGQYHQ